jgi:hypothetical protein
MIDHKTCQIHREPLQKHVVSFTSKWRTERSDEWRSGMNDRTLTVYHRPGKALSLARQVARVYNLESRKASASPAHPSAPRQSRGMRPDIRGEYTSSSDSVGQLAMAINNATLIIRERTWSYTYRLQITDSVKAGVTTRRKLAGNVPDASNMLYSGVISERTSTANRVSIDSSSPNEFKAAEHTNFRQSLRPTGYIWTFVRRNKGLVPKNQNPIFLLHESTDA